MLSINNGIKRILMSLTDKIKEEDFHADDKFK